MNEQEKKAYRESIQRESESPDLGKEVKRAMKLIHETFSRERVGVLAGAVAIMLELDRVKEEIGFDFGVMDLGKIDPSKRDCHNSDCPIHGVRGVEH